MQRAVVALIGVLSGGMLAAAQAPAGKTVWSGVYTVAQAARGSVAYGRSCGLCHSEDLGGGIEGGESVPALRRDGFALGRRDLNNLYAFISEEMPRDNPGGLPEQTYVDIVAYLLQQNGFPAGAAELTPDVEALKKIAIVRNP